MPGEFLGIGLFDFKPGFFKTLNYAQCVQLALTEFTNTGSTRQPGKQPFFYLLLSAAENMQGMAERAVYGMDSLL